MYVALTGTPGTGKSSASAILRQRGHKVRTVEELAREYDVAELVGQELEVDTDALARLAPEPKDTIILEGHLAHFIPNTVCIILRCHPETLRKRLQGRRYSAEKLRENLEAEAIDVILTEALGMWENVFEIDTTGLEPEKVADAIESIINGKGDGHPPGRIDWSGAVMDWY